MRKLNLSIGFLIDYFSSEIIHRIKRNGKLNSKILRGLLSETMEHLDLDGIYLTGSNKLYPRNLFLIFQLF